MPFHSDYPWPRDTLDRAPATPIRPDVKPPPLAAEPGLTDQPGFWPGAILGAATMAGFVMLALAATTFLGRVG